MQGHTIRVRPGGRIMRMLAILFVVWGTLSGDVSAVDSVTPGSPILVELFTSEGCSSCPPADAFLERIDAAQPVPGAQIIVLSEHVDYWDHDGWKDPYSSHLLTERQNSYGHALGLNTVYTPQIIIDGSSELRIGNSQQVVETFQKALAAPLIPVHISAMKAEAQALQVHVNVEGLLARHNADVFVALALNHAESQVLHGENGGKHLTHVAVVQSLAKIGKLEKGKNFDQEVTLKVGTGTDLANVRVIAFAQETGFGKVLGAAMQKSIN